MNGSNIPILAAVIAATVSLLVFAEPAQAGHHRHAKHVHVKHIVHCQPVVRAPRVHVHRPVVRSAWRHSGAIICRPARHVHVHGQHGWNRRHDHRHMHNRPVQHSHRHHGAVIIRW